MLLAAGLADLAVDTAGSALGTARALLRRSDATELASQASDELTARGRLFLDRYATVPPAHLEILARHVLARQSQQTHRNQQARPNPQDRRHSPQDPQNPRDPQDTQTPQDSQAPQDSSNPPHQPRPDEPRVPDGE
ncbi:putative membrane protein [Streptomyces sp. MAA16]|nr:putative membrane protein [Streptomyces sp. MAA16]